MKYYSQPTYRHDYLSIKDRFVDRFPILNDLKALRESLASIPETRDTMTAEECYYRFFWDRYLDGTLEAEEIWPGEEIKRLVTLCSGYDSQSLAFKRLDIPFEIAAWAEFDPESKRPLEEQPAPIAHNLLFPRWSDRNLGDMTKIDWEAFKANYPYDIDLLTYSTPCTDVSSAGLQKGISRDSGTRSSILWYTENAISILMPKYLLQENVKALVSKKFMPYFVEWCRLVESYGYNNFYEVMNAKDYSTPQNRERVFMVSLRKDVGRNRFKFPEAVPLERKLKDVLLTEVDEKYYLDQTKVDSFVEKNKANIEKGSNFKFAPTDCTDDSDDLGLADVSEHQD